MKLCNMCLLTKPLDEFYAGRRGGKCKPCLAILRRETYVKALERYGEPTVLQKRCSKCVAVKPVEEFYKQAKSSDGLHSNCKDCCKDSARESIKRRPKEAISAYHRAKHLKDSYGISMDEFHEMIEAQQGRCRICDRIVDRLVVDHDHDTGAVRELLCASCNSGIGLLGDDPDRLEAAKQYLLRHKIYHK